MTIKPALSGSCIAVPETRELTVFSELLERRGAQVLRCPLVRIVDAPDPAPVLAWAQALIDHGADDVIFTTGEGVRRLVACVRRHVPEREAAFVSALAKVRKIVRGPKPTRALREIGLAADLPATEPTTQGIIAALRGEDLRGRRVGVQLYGSDPNPPLMDFLAEAGAQVHCVAPYAYVDESADQAVVALIDRMAAGEVTAIAFTSMAQVKRLFDVADAHGRRETIRIAFERTFTAAVGPVVADTLAAQGVTVRAMPADSWFMKPLAQVLADSLGGSVA